MHDIILSSDVIAIDNDVFEVQLRTDSNDGVIQVAIEFKTGGGGRFVLRNDG